MFQSPSFFFRHLETERGFLGAKLPKTKLSEWKQNESLLDLFYTPWILFYMGVSQNSGTPKSSILIGFSIINHPFWGTSIFGNIHIFFCNLSPEEVPTDFHFWQKRIWSISKKYPLKQSSWWLNHPFEKTLAKLIKFGSFPQKSGVKIINLWKKTALAMNFSSKVFFISGQHIFWQFKLGIGTTFFSRWEVGGMNFQWRCHGFLSIPYTIHVCTVYLPTF